MKTWLKQAGFGALLLTAGFIAGGFCQIRPAPVAVVAPLVSPVVYPVVNIRDVERTCLEVQEIGIGGGYGGPGKVTQVRLLCTGNGYETRWYIDVDKQTAVGVSYPVLVGRYP